MDNLIFSFLVFKILNEEYKFQMWKFVYNSKTSQIAKFWYLVIILLARYILENVVLENF